MITLSSCFSSHNHLEKIPILTIITITMITMVIMIIRNMSTWRRWATSCASSSLDILPLLLMSYLQGRNMLVIFIEDNDKLIWLWGMNYNDKDHDESSDDYNIEWWKSWYSRWGWLHSEGPAHPLLSIGCKHKSEDRKVSFCPDYLCLTSMIKLPVH